MTVTQLRPMTLGDLEAGMTRDSIETHTSVLRFTDNLAVKTKKPLDLGFVDFTDVATRRAACEREVALNARLAPDVYLGVTELRAADGTSQPAVVMRRLPADRSLTALVSRQAPQVRAGLVALARDLVRFHAQCAVHDGPDSPGSMRHLRAMWDREWDALDELGDTLVEPQLRACLRRMGREYLAGRDELVAERMARGLVRDGHGDLQAADIFLLDSGPRAIDCLEFDDELRIGDVLLDVAFLAMDLERLGAVDEARAFVDAYQEFSAEVHPPSLLHFFIAYRALVRLKVTAIRLAQGSETARGEIRALVGLCERHLFAGSVRVVCVGGLPGSGKTTLAVELARRLDAEYLASDDIRDELAGRPVTHPDPRPWGSGPYSAAATDAVYAEMRRRARIAIAHGMSVVLDASWHNAQQRALIKDLAHATHAVVGQLRCTVDDAVAQERLARRRDTTSDANTATRAAMQEVFAAWDDAFTVDTQGPAERALRESLDVIHAAGS